MVDTRVHDRAGRDDGVVARNWDQATDERTPSKHMLHTDQQQVSLAGALEQLAQAMDNAMAILAKDREEALATIQELHAGRSVVEIAEQRNMAEVRQRLTTALNELEIARGHARNEIFQALQREGQSIGQIARLWGISRQLASRLARVRLSS